MVGLATSSNSWDWIVDNLCVGQKRRLKRSVAMSSKRTSGELSVAAPWGAGNGQSPDAPCGEKFQQSVCREMRNRDLARAGSL